MLKCWRVEEDGCWLDEQRLSDVTLADLKLDAKPYIAVRIGVKPDAVHQGGINLFGEQFGDHKQSVVMRLDCTEKNT